MSEPARIAVLEPDAVSRSVTARVLRDAGYEPVLFESEISFFHEPVFGRTECLIMNEWLPVLSASQLQLVLNSVAARLPVIVISDTPTVDGTVRAMRAGAVDVLPKPFDAHELLTAVDRAMTVRTRALQRRDRYEAIMMRMARLTAREKEVCDHVVSGRLNKQTAALLAVTEKTIKVHRARVMEKLEARSLPELVQLAQVARAASCETKPTARVATWSWDMRQDVVTGNRELADLFGLRDKSASGVSLRACLEGVDPGDIQQLRASIDDAIVSRKPYHTRYRVVGDPERRSCLVAYGRVRYDTAGVPVQFTGVAFENPEPTRR